MIQETIDIITKSKPKILMNWNKIQRDENYSSENLLTSFELQEQSSDLLTVLLKRLSSNSNNVEASLSLDDHLVALSIEWAKRGFTPRETMGFIFNLKNTILLALQENITDPTVLHAESKKVDKFMDSLGVSVFEACIRVRELEIQRQTSEIDEIRTPIIELWDGIVTLPIVGTLDSSRTQAVMDELLKRIAKNNVYIAIVDISGVPAIDSTVAQHMMQLVAAVRLLGAECIVSGIRPEIALTMVNLGINLENITTKATLADALLIAFRKTDIEVTRKPVASRLR